MKNCFIKKQKRPLKKFIYSGNWELEKTLFERRQNNTANGHGGGLPYLKINNLYTVFHFKKSRSFFLKSKIKMQVFFTYSLMFSPGRTISPCGCLKTKTSAKKRSPWPFQKRHWQNPLGSKWNGKNSFFGR